MTAEQRAQALAMELAQGAPDARVPIGTPDVVAHLTAAIADAVAEERAACAHLCEVYAALGVAHRIRSRGQP